MKKLIAIIVFAFAGLFSTSVMAAPPANDHWQNSTPITGTSGTLLSTNADATTQLCEPTHYFGGSTPRASVKSVWYAFTPTENASYTFRIANTNTPLTIAAYRMNLQLCENQFGLFPTVMAENEEFNRNNERSQITFRAAAGQTYYIKVSSTAFNPQDAIYTIAWDKTRFKYFARLRDTRSWGDQLVVRRQGSNLVWYGAIDAESNSDFTPSYTTFGLSTDMPLAGDYDGDGITDYVAIRKVNGSLVWYIGRRDGTIINVQQFGLATDKPKVGDFDGDGIADLCIVRNDETLIKKVWHVLRSSDGQHQQVVHGDIYDAPWVGEYNGDGKTDMVVISTNEDTRDQTWHILLSTSGAIIDKPFGHQGDLPQTADFDGDGRTDICVFRDSLGNGQEGNWYFVKSSMGVFSQINIYKWGAYGDTPQPMETGGSGKTGFVVYRSGFWWMADSVDPTRNWVFSWGSPTDIPMGDLGQRQYYIFN